MTIAALGHATTHVGRRSANQDCFCVDPKLGLFAVADGIGGYLGGEVASRLAVESLRDLLASHPEPNGAPLGERVRLAVRAVGGIVAERSVGTLCGMCTTLALLVVEDGLGCVAHVGDSRVYRLRRGTLERLTRDHSVVAEMEAVQGYVTESVELALGHIVTQYIGHGATPNPDVRHVFVETGDRYLLCTDGLTETLDDADITELLGSGTPDSACESLVRAAYEVGASDNITAVVVEMR
jgi:serine/threonine protein phosphatase PrpC